MSQFCKNCGAPLRPGAKFCRTCGTKIPEGIVQATTPDISSVNAAPRTAFCRFCGAPVSAGNKFCMACGKPIRSAVQHPANVYNVNNMAPAAPRKKKRRRIWIPITAVVTAAALTLTLILTLGKPPQDESAVYMPGEAVFTEKEVIAQGAMNPDGAMIQSADGTVTMAFDALCIDEPAKARIVRLDVENPPEDSILNVYDFSVDSKEEVAGVVTIEVPYDPAQIPAGRSAADCVDGVYYDEELHEWIEETYTIDESRNTVMIKTTHLSPHGTRIAWNDDEKRLLDLIITVCEGTPYEYAIPIDSDRALGRLTQEEMVELIEELTKNGAADPQQALNDASIKILSDLEDFSSLGVDTFKLTSYAGKWTKGLGNRLAELAGALVLAQLASDVYYEKPQAETYFNLLKGLTYWKGAAAAAYLTGPVGGTIATAVLAGMFLYEFFVEPIDIPQYIEESNHQVIVDAYDTYYHSGENHRSKNEWMKKIDAIVNEAYQQEKTGGDFDDVFKELLDKEVTAYATEFFNEKPSHIRQYVSDSFDFIQGYLGSYDRVYSATDKKRNEEYVEEYVTEILSGEYEGVTTSLQDELINRLKQEIYKDTIPKIMDMRKEYQYLKQLEYLRQTLQKMCQYFNTKFSLVISDGGRKDNEVSQYSGFYIAPKITQPDPEYKLEKWIIQLNKNGDGQLDYNLIAHQMAGDFTQLCLYDKDDYDKILAGTAEPVKVLDIGTISSNIHNIVIDKDKGKVEIKASSPHPDVDEEIVLTAETNIASADYEWQLSDTGTEMSIENSITHTYPKAGTYSVQVTAYDEDGGTIGTDSIEIEVQEPEEETTAPAGSMDGKWVAYEVDYGGHNPLTLNCSITLSISGSQFSMTKTESGGSWTGGGYIEESVIMGDTLYRLVPDTGNEIDDYRFEEYFGLERGGLFVSLFDDGNRLSLGTVGANLSFIRE